MHKNLTGPQSIGETDLTKLLASMDPALQNGIYVFCTLPDRTMPPAVTPIGQFQEAEGLTLIVRQEQAEAAGLSYTYPARMVTLTVHSSLAAVGFLARVTARLAAENISVNPVSGYYHDHLFVPVDRAEQALAVLRRLAAGD